MKKRRTAYQRKWRGEWHPAVEWLRVPLIVVAVLVSLPVMLPVGLVRHGLVERRRRRVAARTPCARCGSILGEAALARADDGWAEHVAKLHRDHPHVKFRLVRREWAVCVACGQRYDYDEKTHAFVALEDRDTAR